MRAKIYREINFYENALDHYFNGLRSYKAIIEEVISPEDNIGEYSQLSFYLCPLIPFSYFEVSKLLFDKGQIIESLVCQLKSIKFALIISSLKDGSNTNSKLIDIFNNIKKAIHILKNLKQFFTEYVRKDIILSLFINGGVIEDIQNIIRREISGEKKVKTILLQPQSPLISPKEMGGISGLVRDDLRPLLADVLARIGFTLYTIRLKVDETKFEEAKRAVLKEKNQKVIEEIKHYLRGFGGGESKYESELGTYTLTLLGEVENNRDFISHRIERVFSAAAIEKLRRIFGTEEEKLCAKLTRHSLTNVGNIASIPLRVDKFLAQDGYEKRTNELYNHRPRLNKLVILRRWQSFNPKVPRPKGQVIRGGGYFLYWKGKGIVIDPGYDFIQNFYEEGFSIGDINAIIVTHTHPDHEDELNTIITLLAEWNEFQQKKGYIEGVKKGKRREKTINEEGGKYIDLFLNEGAYRKYHTWLYGKDIMIKKIILLQSSRWDRLSQKSSDMKAAEADANPRIDLRKNYHMEIEIVPSWHDELIDKHASIGFILHLYDDPKKNAFKIGFTGDTECYEGIEDSFKNVDILVAHLGDVKLRELLARFDKTTNEVINKFIEKWYGIKGTTIDKLHKKFLDYLILQDLYGVERRYIRTGAVKKEIKNQFRELREAIGGNKHRKDIIDAIRTKFTDYYMPSDQYVYKNHLGITGIFKLYNALLTLDDTARRSKLMIVGELPEELQSYRHVLACILEELSIKPKHQGRCFTGDVGLTVGLPTKGITYGRPPEPGCTPKNINPKIAIRCMKCFQNNEYVYGLNKDGKVAKTILENEEIYLPHYHGIYQIQETSLKACSSRIAWFCQEYHGRAPRDAEQEFLVTPDIRDVWG